MTQQERYDLRKSAGICVRCARNPAVPGGTMCAACNEVHREYRKQWRAQAARNGLCMQCGQKNDGPGTVCSACTTFRKRQYVVRKQLRKAHGICTACGKRPAAPGSAYCATCEAQREYMLTQRTKKLVLGRRCTRCCAPLPEGDRHKTCPTCRHIKKTPEAVKQFARKKKAQADARRASGLCTLCGVPLPPGSEHVTCLACRKKQQQYRRNTQVRKQEAKQETRQEAKQ